MSILKRVFNIARAEANARFGRKRPEPSYTPPPEEPHQERKRESNQQKQQRESQYQAPSQVDEWYAALEIPSGSDLATVQKAWKTLLRKYHPDKHSSDPEKAKLAHEVSVKLNEALEGLQKHLKGSS